MRPQLAALAALTTILALAGAAFAQDPAPDTPPAAVPPAAAPAEPLGFMERMRLEALGGDTLEERIAKASAFPLGSKDNPVRVNMPQGEHSYLLRLRCSNNKAPRYERIGSFGVGVFGAIIDGYDVVCTGRGEPKKSLIYMDMYHPAHDETAAPEGFTLEPAR